MANINTRLKQLEKHLGFNKGEVQVIVNRSTDSGISHRFKDYWEEREFIDWRSRQIKEDHVLHSSLPFVTYAFTREDVDTRLEGFRIYRTRVKEIGQEFEKKLKLVLLSDGDEKQSVQELIKEADGMITMAGRVHITP